MFGAFATLFGQGLLHGLGPDHCLAIGTLAAADGGMRKAVGVSLRFGAGHTVVLAAGALVAGLTGLVIPEAWESTLEVLGGASLLALGCWTVLSKRGMFAHTHDDGLVHAHDDQGDPGHRSIPVAGARFQTIAGAVFGLSGVRGLLMVLPFMTRGRAWALVVGVALFGLGVVASMLAVGWFAQRAAAAARSFERGLRVPVGVASMLCGAWWIVDHV